MGKAVMTVEVGGNEKLDWRAHVHVLPLPSRRPQHHQHPFPPHRASPKYSEFDFQNWRNFYLSNRELSTEFRYCFDRKTLPRFMGNTLPKPKLLLKRTFAQVTAGF